MTEPSTLQIQGSTAAMTMDICVTLFLLLFVCKDRVLGYSLWKVMPVLDLRQGGSFSNPIVIVYV